MIIKRTRTTILANAGFGLVEIMVGLAIGMIATLVIVQVAAMFEGQKRSTTGTADAQTSGAMAIYSMQRQIQMAGYGLPVFSSNAQVLNCSDKPLIDADGDPGTPDVEVSLSPLEIIDGVAGANDRIIVRKGNTSFGGMPLSYPPTPDKNYMSCSKGDLVLVTDGTTCAVTTVKVAPTKTVQIQFDKAIASPTEGTFACLGEWQEFTYEIVNNNLMERGVQIAGGVVSMQAQYGVSLTGKESQVIAYVDAKDPEWGPTMTKDNRNRIKAIRVALVIRNSVMEKENVTEPCSSLTASAPKGLCAWEGAATTPAPAIDLSADPDWRKYRYRVFDTLIPMRNIIWSADKLL